MNLCCACIVSWHCTPPPHSFKLPWNSSKHSCGEGTADNVIIFWWPCVVPALSHNMVPAPLPLFLSAPPPPPIYFVFCCMGTYFSCSHCSSLWRRCSSRQRAAGSALAATSTTTLMSCDARPVRRSNLVPSRRRLNHRPKRTPSPPLLPRVVLVVSSSAVVPAVGRRVHQGMVVVGGSSSELRPLGRVMERKRWGVEGAVSCASYLLSLHHVYLKTLLCLSFLFHSFFLTLLLSLVAVFLSVIYSFILSFFSFIILRMYLWWSLCTLFLPTGESYCRWFGFWTCSCDAFWVQNN